MAIFSLNHSFIGRTTHKPGTASLFVRYITRSEACTTVQAARMPATGSAAMGWLDDQEQGDRKNARVIDKLIVALPIELTREQNIELLNAFAERMSEGRASWLYAIHDGPGDADNPHAHVIFRDRDFETGKRVMLTTEQGSTQRFRDGWEQEANIALERAGRDERIDKRSLADQGIDREPQIHVGAGANHLAQVEHEFQSAEKQTIRRINGENVAVTINYPVIDEGKTRFEENEEIKERNRELELEYLALYGPVRPDAHPMERVVSASYQLTALYRRATQNGGHAGTDDDTLTIIVREHIAERDAGQKRHDPSEIVMDGQPFAPIDADALARQKPGVGRQPGQPFAPIDAETLARNKADVDDTELKRAKQDYVSLRREPGMTEVLKARDYLYALSYDWQEPLPTDQEVVAYAVWQSQSREPAQAEGRGDGAKAAAPRDVSAPDERGPTRDAVDLLAGAGLGIVGKIAEKVESLFDGPTGQEIEEGERVMGEERKVAQKTVEKQQKLTEEQMAEWQRVELQLYLDQRARERGMERGR